MHASAPRQLAMVAHDGRKAQLRQFALEHAETLRRWPIVATRSSARLLRDAHLDAEAVASGPLGGDAQLAARIAEDKLQAVIFFRDPNAAHPHEHDVQALLRLCDVYDVPLATNPASAQLLIAGLQGDAAGARGADARALRAL